MLLTVPRPASTWFLFSVLFPLVVGSSPEIISSLAWNGEMLDICETGGLIHKTRFTGNHDRLFVSHAASQRKKRVKDASEYKGTTGM
ncbi:hypothetical protein FB45DRAFT_514704 [Roridomyces roridus]|uniref:Secreted protein n=1 Tax=Roridomyces roridus TaxID=1738132 RepID=A0AAD7BWR1_9AGAR|nr:hypothetical protein FB45DRAFT_514704 [Roridomyces roridus]